MNQFWQRFLDRLPMPLQEAWYLVLPMLQIALIVVVAVTLRHLVRRLIARMTVRYALPIEFNVGARRIAGFLIYGSATLLVLERLGVSGSVLWSAFTGFAAVAAVAFFAAWSVLSNIFCSLLVFTTRLFRLHDHVELLENGEKPGLKGRVIDINLIYTTLEETGDGARGTELKVPNSLFFQRTLRRWHGPIEDGGRLPAKPYQAPEAAAGAAPAAPSAPATSAAPAQPAA
jgi:small-conductance mechanosensitive channel